MKSIVFYKTPDELKNMASYVAQLTKEAVTFEIKDLQDRVEVRLTGGF